MINQKDLPYSTYEKENIYLSMIIILHFNDILLILAMVRKRPKYLSTQL